VAQRNCAVHSSSRQHVCHRHALLANCRPPSMQGNTECLIRLQPCSTKYNFFTLALKGSLACTLYAVQLPNLHTDFLHAYCVAVLMATAPQYIRRNRT